MKILVTRPAQQMQPLCQCLQARGFLVLRLPTMTIEALAFAAALQRALSDDGVKATHCIVVSPNAASLLSASTVDYLQCVNRPVYWYAVGPTSAQVLESLGIEARFPEMGASDALLTNSNLSRPLTQEQVLIFKGEGGRRNLHDALAERGADVQSINMYRRTCPQYSARELQAIWQQRPDWAIITSNTGLKNLVTLFNRGGHVDKNAIVRLPLLVVSERIAKCAQALGFARHAIHVAQGASNTALLAALETLSK